MDDWQRRMAAHRLDEDLQLIHQHALKVYEADNHAEALSSLAILRLRLATTEQRIGIVRLLQGERRLSQQLLLAGVGVIAAGIGWLLRGWLT